uniref:Uncharacterized protein n=1 Tax=Rhizophagus irregularis (strain DAOM 181602 / DAOM 197198 / MUCL 43194) TaxID=747089 RepID=U9SQ47_RHIID
MAAAPLDKIFNSSQNIKLSLQLKKSRFCCSVVTSGNLPISDICDCDKVESEMLTYEISRIFLIFLTNLGDVFTLVRALCVVICKELKELCVVTSEILELCVEENGEPRPTEDLVVLVICDKEDNPTDVLVICDELELCVVEDSVPEPTEGFVVLVICDELELCVVEESVPEPTEGFVVLVICDELELCVVEESVPEPTEGFVVLVICDELELCVVKGDVPKPVKPVKDFLLFCVVEDGVPKPTVLAICVVFVILDKLELCVVEEPKMPLNRGCAPKSELFEVLEGGPNDPKPDAPKL